jgi:dimethylglycine dehydrogenase
MRFVSMDKHFVGREALLENMAAPRWMLAYLEVDPGDLDADCLGGEAVFAEDRRIGVVTTAGYGFSTGKSLAWAYVDPGLERPGTELSVLVLAEPRPAVVLGEAVWDPGHERARA